MHVCKRPEVKTHTDRFIKLIRHSFGFSQLNWSAQEKRGLTKQPWPQQSGLRGFLLLNDTGSQQRKKHLSHGYVSLLRSYLVWKSHNAPPHFRIGAGSTAWLQPEVCKKDYGFAGLWRTRSKPRRKLKRCKKKRLTSPFSTHFLWLLRDCWQSAPILKQQISGCKENHFYSLPFRQAEASIY